MLVTDDDCGKDGKAQRANCDDRDGKVQCLNDRFKSRISGFRPRTHGQPRGYHKRASQGVSRSICKIRRKTILSIIWKADYSGNPSCLLEILADVVRHGLEFPIGVMSGRENRARIYILVFNQGMLIGI